MCLLIIGGLMGGLVPQAFAGAWPAPPGTGQIIITNVHDRADRGYDDEARLSQAARFLKTETRIYWEHGLTEKLTLVGETALQDVDYTSQAGREKVFGIGNSTLGLRYGFDLPGPWLGAVQGSAKIAGSGENISDADLGHGGHGVEGRVLAGRSFKFRNRPGFTDLQAAWILRPGGRPDSYKADVTLGWDVREKWQILGQAFYDRTNEQVIGIDRVLANENIKLQLSFLRQSSEKGAWQISCFETVWGRNIIRERGLSVGWHRFY